MSYVELQPNGRGPIVNLEMTVDRDEKLALVFIAEEQASGDQITDYYIEEPKEIEEFFAEVRRLEAEYRKQAASEVNPG